MIRKVGFIGLGAMGAPMARNLVAAGYDVRGYDVDGDAVQTLVDAGGTAASSAAGAAEGAAILFVLVFTAEQADAALFGPLGAMETLPAGATVAMHTTMSPQAAEALEARLAGDGYRFVDAPVTGGVMGAEAGTLTFIASGSADAMASVHDAFEIMGAKTALCGDRAGAASTVKMVNQLLCGIHVVAACEGIALAARAGADPRTVLEVISSGAARSFVWDTRVPTILARDFEPRGVVDIFLKDLDIVLQAGKALGFPLPMTATALQQFVAAGAQGHGRRDDASVVKIYEQLAGVDVAAAAEREQC